MKATTKPAIVTLALVLGVCMLVPSAAYAQKGMPCTSDPVDMFIMYGNLITCSLDQAGIADIYRFDGIAGQRIEIVASSGVTNPCIELVGVTSQCNFNYSREWIDVVLPTTQEYTIKVYDYSSNGTGTYELDLESVVPPSPNARQTAYDMYLTDQINPAGDIEPLFYFTASAGDVVDIVTQSSTTNPCIALYAPDAKTSWGACNFNYSREEITQKLPAAGTYTILIYDYSANGSGAYSVDLTCLSGPCVVTQIPDLAGYVILRGTPLAGAGVSLTQPGAPGPQLTRTDNNGYYQFMHIVPNNTFNVLIHDSDSLNQSGSGDAGSTPKVREQPPR
jgi:hypothetical protein